MRPRRHEDTKKKPLGNHFVSSTLVILLATLAVPTRAANVLDDLKGRFNEDKGVLRLVVLVSPTCPQCTSGAGWVQEYILTRNPKLNVKVYAIWYEMYPGDSPDDFPKARKLLADKRVTHYWDQGKDVGRWYHGKVPTDTKGNVEWDAFYLYSESSQWGEEPSDLLTWGLTILRDRNKLSAEVARVTGVAPAAESPEIERELERTEAADRPAGGLP
jgi:hypothetical protein